MVEKETLYKQKPKVSIPNKVGETIFLETTLEKIKTLDFSSKENLDQNYLQQVKDLRILRFYGYFSQQVPQS